jgi:hypothetical protein
VIGTILLVIIVLALIGAFAGRGHPGLAPYGWYPSGGLGLILLIVIVLLVLGRL